MVLSGSRKYGLRPRPSSFTSNLSPQRPLVLSGFRKYAPRPRPSSSSLVFVPRLRPLSASAQCRKKDEREEKHAKYDEGQVASQRGNADFVVNRGTGMRFLGVFTIIRAFGRYTFAFKCAFGRYTAAFIIVNHYLHAPFLRSSSLCQILSHINGAGEQNYYTLDNIEQVLIYREEIEPDEYYLQ